ncbi:MAG TPA: metallophosphoesterase [Candidatus Methanoperedenaceae archaeon]|nr:metallophosphoesterase [Candidatus Methanoperedenaceae archaeon]
MKLLAIADLHGDYTHVNAIRERAGSVDAILIAGDLTDFGPDEKAHELFDMLGSDVPVLAIPGNCDYPGILKVIEKAGAINMHNRTWKIDNTEFIGFGGSNPTPFGTPFEISEKKILENVGQLISRAKGERLVLLSHAPPKDTLDRVPSGANAGSTALADRKGTFDLVVCGHIHESRGVMSNGNGSVIVNPGPAFKGCAALIDLDSEITASLIQV